MSKTLNRFTELLLESFEIDNFKLGFEFKTTTIERRERLNEWIEAERELIYMRLRS